MTHKDNKKILGILRVSTTKQGTESQKTDMLNFLTSKGYKEEEIEWIEAKGASARKVNKKYLDFIEEIKQKTEGENGIKTVALWHLNRLGRIKYYLTMMEHYFVTNQIQLYVKNGFDMPLLDENGKETLGASIAFSVYASMIEIETEEMMEKMKRGRKENELQNKWNGGKLKLGYTVDENNYIVVDPEKSEIVRRIFRLYTEENWSCKKIYDHYRDEGLFYSHKFKNHGYKNVTSILKDRTYSEGKGNSFPPFIPVELQEKAISMLERFRDRKRSDNVYFCKGILFDKKTGVRLGASRGTLVYTHLIKDNSYNISINALDYICWLSARKNYLAYELKTKAQNLIDFTQAIKLNEKRIETLVSNIETLREEIERGIERNIKTPQYFNSERLDNLIKENEKQMSKIENEINTLKLDNSRMKQYIENNKSDNLNKGKRKQLWISDEFFTQMPDEKKKEIIDLVISKIVVERLEEKHYTIKIYPRYTPTEEPDTWDYLNKGHKIHLTITDTKGNVHDHTKELYKEENKHFIREDYWRRYYQPKKEPRVD